MPSPTNPVLDDFNRSDETLDTGNWRGPYSLTAAGAMKLISNQAGSLFAGASNAESWWNRDFFAPNQEVFATVAVPPPNNHELGLHVRMKQPTPGVDNEDDYALSIGGTASGCTIALYSRVDEVATLLDSVSAVTVSAGDKFWLTAIGDELTVYHDTGGGYASLFSVNDTAWLGGGQIAFYAKNTTARWDSFGGGSLPPEGPQIYRYRTP